ncbi:MAG: endonuclease domain-containing protein [Clostridiales Family XIII bacterium]|jgi:very-short-patch-repair endonuclease|nr:endonuclease domain-containing protein [Clostridiales Family XIII bacterium]
MKIEYARNNQYDSRQFEQIGPSLFVLRADWAQASALARHRALTMFYANGPANPKAVFSGVSGAVMRGIPILGEIPLKPRCYSSARRGATQDLIRWRYSPKLPACELVDGVRVACVERVLIDLCIELDAAACLAALNHCVFTRMTTVRKLKGYLGKHPGVPGVRRLARLLPFANAKCESPLESLGWLSIYRSKLVLPRQQVEIKLPLGGRAGLARVDMCWDAATTPLIVELDGKVKYKTQEDLINEKIREDGLRMLGCRVLRFLWDDVMAGKMAAKLKSIGVAERRNFGRKIPSW